VEQTGERYIPGQSGIIAIEHLNRYYFVIHQIRLKHKVVVDLASGEGYGSELLANYAEKVYGIDISIEAIDHARQKYRKSNLEFLVGDALKIPLEDKIADIFVSFETIEHLEYHDDMINEIKRVLKPSGLLIISSPDKLNYSDIPKLKNEYHRKELYFKQFKNLIEKKFRHSSFFAQRIYSGSIIAIDDELIQYKKPLIIRKDGYSEDFSPVYNIAIATDHLNFSIEYPIICYSEIDRLITEKDLEYENWRGQQKVRNSLSYRIGFLITYPFKTIIRVIKIIAKQSLAKLT